MRLPPRLAAFSLYGAGWVLLLSAGWLLPNHFWPWQSFHTNAWVGAVLAVLALWRTLAARGPTVLGASVVPLILMAFVPMLHHAAGLVPIAGDAVLQALIVGGAALAYAAGQAWARQDRHAPADAIFAASLIAAVASVAIQVYQWFGHARGELGDVWIYPFSGTRPYANLAQPNQLASLLLWGLVGCAWFWHRRKLPAGLAVAMAAVLVFGVALTESRMALLNLTLGVLAIALAPAGSLSQTARHVGQGLYAAYLAILFNLERLASLLAATPALGMLGREEGVGRLAIWRTGLDASTARPWLGWGWGNTNQAYLHVAPDHPELQNGYFEHAHNLLIDLVLWTGWPLALLLAAGALVWWYRSWFSRPDTAQVLVLAALVAMGVHAMLELPLHQVYFLWPYAMLAGVASARWDVRQVLRVPKVAASAVLLAVSALGAVIVIDYMRVDAAFREWRFQLYRIGSNHDETIPPLHILKEWGDYMAFMREKPRAGMTNAEVDRWRELFLYNMSPLGMRKAIAAMALNGRPEEAAYWTERACVIMDPRICRNISLDFDGPNDVPPGPASVGPAH